MTSWDQNTDAEFDTPELDNFRASFAKYFIPFLGTNALLVGIVGFAYGQAMWWASFLLAALLAAVPAFLYTKAATSLSIRYSSSAAIAGMVALLVNAFAGSPYQIDMHMYFFATLAIVAGWCDWRALLVNAAVIAVHHLVLNFVYPLAVFPDGANFSRVVLHAVIVVMQTGTLAWVTMKLANALSDSSAAIDRAKQAQSKAQSLGAEQKKMRQADADRQEKIRTTISAFHSEIKTHLELASSNADQLDATARSLSEIADETTTKVLHASEASQEASSNVDSVASTTEELSSSISEITRQIETTNGVVLKATDNAQCANEKVASLAEASQKIGEVLSLISDIAEQTNLLALNATIEAARAGEAGKGFAVVASEVKSLATQTGKATEEIGQQIDGIQASTVEAVEAIRAISETMEEVNGYTSAVSTAIEEQGAATVQIAQSVQNAAAGTRNAADNMSGVADSVEVTSSSANDLLAASGEANKQAASLNQAINRFLDEIAAA